MGMEQPSLTHFCDVKPVQGERQRSLDLDVRRPRRFSRRLFTGRTWLHDLPQHMQDEHASGRVHLVQP